MYKIESLKSEDGGVFFACYLVSALSGEMSTDKKRGYEYMSKCEKREKYKPKYMDNEMRQG